MANGAAQNNGEQCPDDRTLLIELRNQVDATNGMIAAFIAKHEANVAQYKKEREDMVAMVQQNRDVFEEHTAGEAPKLYAIQTKLNLALALVVSACLFGLAGPAGLREIGNLVTGSGLGADGVLALLGFGIPFLVPLGNKLFVRVVSPKDTRRSVIVSRE